MRGTHDGEHCTPVSHRQLPCAGCVIGAMDYDGLRCANQSNARTPIQDHREGHPTFRRKHGQLRQTLRTCGARPFSRPQSARAAANRGVKYRCPRMVVSESATYLHASRTGASDSVNWRAQLPMMMRFPSRISPATMNTTSLYEMPQR